MSLREQLFTAIYADNMKEVKKLIEQALMLMIKTKKDRPL